MTGRVWGHVIVRPGAIRPAYRENGETDTVVYSPEGSGAWRDAPEHIARTWIRWHSDAEGWRPATHLPDDLQMVN